MYKNKNKPHNFISILAFGHFFFLLSSYKCFWCNSFFMLFCLKHILRKRLFYKVEEERLLVQVPHSIAGVHFKKFTISTQRSFSMLKWLSGAQKFPSVPKLFMFVNRLLQMFGRALMVSRGLIEYHSSSHVQCETIVKCVFGRHNFYERFQLF